MVARPEPSFGGRSLAFMRVITRGGVPRAASVRSLFKEALKDNKAGLPNPPLRVGQVILFPSVGKDGDCALYLGAKRMMIMPNTGIATIVRLDYYGAASFYILGDST